VNITEFHERVIAVRGELEDVLESINDLEQRENGKTKWLDTDVVSLLSDAQSALKQAEAQLEVGMSSLRPAVDERVESHV